MVTLDSCSFQIILNEQFTLMICLILIIIMSLSHDLKWMNRVVQRGYSTKGGIKMSWIKVVALHNVGTKIEFLKFMQKLLHWQEQTNKKKTKIGILLHW